MKAAVLLGKKTMEVRSLHIPSPASNEVVVRVKACGVCGTDQHIFHGQPGSAEVHPPIVLGHELSGEITSVGDQVKTLKPGDRVSIDPNIYCGNCRYCREGRVHLCSHLQAIGVTRDGGMGQYCTAPAANCYLLPEELSYEEGALIEPLGCVLHGIQQLHIKPGASVLVLGGGFIGLMMAQMAKLYGASSVIVSEPDARKRESALQLGADAAVNPSKGSLKEQLANLGVLDGADIVIECVGRKDTMEQAVQWAGKGGQILLFGVASPDTTIHVSPFEIFSKELQIKGSFINPHTHFMAISLIQQGRVDIKPLISHTFTIDELQDIMVRYAQLGIVKGIIKHE